MMEKKIISKASLEKLVSQLSAEGKIFYAPVKKDEVLNFERISSLKEMADDYILTVQSAKSIVFPKVEKLYDFETTKEGVTIKDVDIASIPEIVLLGARPCDAAAFGSLNAIFTWDYKDTVFVTRLKRTTVIGFSCHTFDEYCFCTSVGLSPGGTKGSDILLTKIDDNSYLAEIISEKGNEILTKHPGLFVPSPDVEKEKYIADVPERFNLKEVSENLKEFFESDIWLEQSLRCLGCGACAFVCPTCACFDIQDENSGKCGSRLRCWDSCGFSLFTLHTSGHNPREAQSQRWRQRVMHKFSYMPDRLDVTGCVGCGRCSRACPVDMNLLEYMIKLAEVKK
ncbi:MAG: 4Fe-4S dicluster domain-containing protein [Bacteroidota bacterium]